MFRELEIVHSLNIFCKLVLSSYKKLEKVSKEFRVLSVQNVYLVESQNSKAHYRILSFHAVLKMLSYTLLPCTKVILSVLQRNLWTISVNLSNAVWLWASPKLSTTDKSGEKTWWNENPASSIIIFLSHAPGVNRKTTHLCLQEILQQPMETWWPEHLLKMYYLTK